MSLLRLCKLLAYEDGVADALHAPARARIEGRRPERLTRAQAETRVMPGAPHGVADDQPLRERSVVVRAMRADGKQRLAPSHDDDVIVFDTTGDGRAIWKIAEWQTFLEVGLWRVVCVGPGHSSHA